MKNIAPNVPEFETELLKEVRRTVIEVWRVAGKPKVFLAVDGVVPMAKIRQQRVRRFKSAWLQKNNATQEWDKNAITPGTEFMDKLTLVLEGVCKEYSWTMSGVREPGEGEHKIMKLIRASSFNSVIVYGLDADLILLSMLTGSSMNTKMYLLREKQEFGDSPPSLEQEYTFLDIQEFRNCIGIQTNEEILNYVALMSLMGNDFLPHSLTNSLSEDGHESVLKELMGMKRSGNWLVKSGEICLNVLGDIVGRWAKEEEERFTAMIRKKQAQAKRGVGKGMDESEGLPLEWNIEKDFITNSGLVSDWRDIYWTFIPKERDELCGEYIRGCNWILKYYTGLPVSMSWMFPAWIPPLWSDLEKYIKAIKSKPESTFEINANAEPSPEEQLAMVLPLESWGLVRSRELRHLPSLAPHMWPMNFSFFSFGRKWLWQCEALVPVLTAPRLRTILKTGV